MRLFILIITIFINYSTTASADPVTKEMAGRYYQNCVTKQASQKLSKESQEFLCACTASKMMDSMTTEDIAAMGAQDQETARGAMNHMIIKVYAPCMEYPAKDHYYNTCISNPKMKSLGSSPEKLCECMAGKVAAHLGQNGEAIFAGILGRNPNITDPMSALEADQKFQNYVGKQVMGCIR